MMTLWIIFLLLAKHLVCDFMIQSAWMIRNKGTYLHPGGITHAAIHALVSGVILSFFGFIPAALMGVVAMEFLIHYHMDWIKAHFNKWNAGQWQFWWFTGVDQFVHQLTYLGMIAILLMAK